MRGTYSDAVRNHAEAAVREIDSALVRLNRNPDRPEVTEGNLEDIRQERRSETNIKQTQTDLR